MCSFLSSAYLCDDTAAAAAARHPYASVDWQTTHGVLNGAVPVMVLEYCRHRCRCHGNPATAQSPWLGYQSHLPTPTVRCPVLSIVASTGASCHHSLTWPSLPPPPPFYLYNTVPPHQPSPTFVGDPQTHIHTACMPCLKPPPPPHTHTPGPLKPSHHTHTCHHPQWGDSVLPYVASAGASCQSPGTALQLSSNRQSG